MDKPNELTTTSGYNPPKNSGILKPCLSAAIITIIYLLFSGAYIWISDAIVLTSVSTLEAYANIQTIKGSIFILVTSLLIFFLLYTAFRRILGNERQILHQQDALITAERNATVGLMASSVAHDINNILTVTINTVDLLKQSVTCSDNEQKLFDRLVDENNKLKTLAKRLQDSGKEQLSESVERITVDELVLDLRNFRESHKLLRNCGFEIAVSGIHEMYALTNLLHQALYNLLINAAEAMEGQGDILVKIDAESHTTTIEVQDSGPGISKEEATKVFQPYHTTKSKGTGLGLVSVNSCAEMHNGKISLEESELGGTCFRLELPQWRS